MKCSPKTMLKIGLALAAIFAGGFLLIPQFRPVIIGLVPFALFALCPISMFFAMRGINPVRNKVSNGVNKGHNEHKGCATCGQSQSSNQRVEKHNHGTR